MTRYRCDVCKTFEYEVERGDSRTDIKPGTPTEEFPEDWRCPICDSDRTHLKPASEPSKVVSLEETLIREGAESIVLSHIRKVDVESYLGEWRREVDSLEVHMEDIHRMSVTGESIVQPMRTMTDVISWEEILIKGAQLARMPLNE